MKIAVVGSNRGIGLEIAKKLISDKHDVYAFCRKPSEALENSGVKKIVTGFEVTSLNEMKAKLSSLNEKDFDALIHVSGILKSDSLDDFNVDDITTQFKVNSLGPILSSKAFKPYLKSDAKVALLTSRMGSIEDNSSGDMYGYRMSKAALNMAGKNLANDYRDEGVTVLMLHPGYVQTDMTNHNGNVTPKESAEKLVDLIMNKNFKDTGTFWHMNGEQLPW
jgi:NAD(P)-dependent dehydrogenase (short-subunit alcohol dehydrogenase family)